MIIIETIMQAPTHFLMGVLIFKIVEFCAPSLNNIILYILVFIFSFLSHFLIDAIAKITYHVPDPRPEDKFWVVYHIFIVVFTLVLLIILWDAYWIALIGSILIDLIDWVLYRAIMKKEPIIHPLIDKFRDKFFFWLPDLLEKKWTVVNEFIIWAIICVNILFL